MKHFLKALVLGGLLSLQSGFAHAEEISPERHADIEKLLTMTHAMQRGQQMSDVLIHLMNDNLKKTHPNIPPKVLDAIPEEVSKLMAEQLPLLEEQLITVYAQYYSADDVKKLIDFYSSDIGQKTIQIAPQIMRDSVAKGMVWGQSLGPEIAKRLKERFKKDDIDI